MDSRLMLDFSIRCLLIEDLIINKAFDKIGLSHYYIYMNSKGFHEFKRGVKGSNPMSFLPVLGLAGLAYLLKDCIYYGT